MSASRKSLEAALATARATVAALEAALTEPDVPSLLGLKEIMATYGVGRDALLSAANRGELELHRGPRRRILVSTDALEGWLKSRTHTPRPRLVALPHDLDEWDREQSDELRAAGGG